MVSVLIWFWVKVCWVLSLLLCFSIEFRFKVNLVLFRLWVVLVFNVFLILVLSVYGGCCIVWLCLEVSMVVCVLIKCSLGWVWVMCVNVLFKVISLVVVVGVVVVVSSSYVVKVVNCICMEVF